MIAPNPPAARPIVKIGPGVDKIELLDANFGRSRPELGDRPHHRF
jgi:hypothetical protein